MKASLRWLLRLAGLVALDPAPEHIQTVQVQPGDIVVMQYPGRLSDRAVENIRAAWKDAAKGVAETECIVLEEGLQLKAVVRPRLARLAGAGAGLRLPVTPVDAVGKYGEPG